MGARGALAALAAGALLALAAPSALAGSGAGGATEASLRPSLLPDRLGARTVLTLSFRFSGGAGGVPAPLRGMAVRLPAGLRVDLGGAAICPRARLQRRGPGGCPTRSLVGRGHATMRVHAGSQLLSEEVAVTVLRGAGHGSQPTLEIFTQGETPLDESTIDTGVLASDSAPYGSRLSVAFPPIPTVALEPDASFASLSLTIGGVGGSPKAHAAAASIRVPRSCPGGGFPFGASFTFADGSAPSVSTTAPCP